MPGLPATFELGDIEWKGTTPGGRKPQTTLLDEVSIYRRPLSAGEVQTCFAAGISQLVARSRPLLSIPVIAAAPTIDGKAPVAEWAKASRLRGFRLVQDKLQGDDAIGLDQGLSLLSSHDDARLYLAFQRQMEAGVTLVSAPRERDADLSQDDSVVVELAAVWNGIDKPTESYRFEVNLSGSRADAKVDKAGKADPSWNPEWQAAASAENLDRVMEFAIPYAAMGRPAPVAGERWGIRLLSRTAIAGGGKSVAFWGGSPATGEWGELAFRADGTQVLVKGIHTNRKGEVDLDVVLVHLLAEDQNLFAA